MYQLFYMKNIIKIASLICIMLFHLIGNAQEVREGKIMVGKNEMAGYIATCKYNKTLVQEAIAGKLNGAGIAKISKKKKFYTLKNISLPEISPYKIDLYYKIQKKKHKSIVYFIVSKGYDNYITSASDAVISANINNFLHQIDGIVAHNEEVKQKEEELQKMNEKIEKEKNDVKKAEDEKAKKVKELQDLQKS